MRKNDNVPLFSVQKQAEHQLRARPYLALRRVSCDYQNGVLILEGIVPSYYLKQVAQTAVVGLDGVQEIENRIEVTTVH